jgi:1,4-dihydroxy-2-naphthoate octaprenyltransferase
MLIRLNRFYRLLNILSIDVALGAVCCAVWFSLLFNSSLKPQALASLGLTVWIIYTADHLLDARKIQGQASTNRHRYHQQHFKWLVFSLVIAVAIDLVFVVFIRKIVFQWGLLLSGLMVLYFLTQQYLKYLKEFIIALLFSFGVLLPSMAIAQRYPDFFELVVVIEFFLTALLNLLLFSWFDRHHDIRDKRESMVTLLGEQQSKRVLQFVFAVNMVLIVGSFLYAPHLIGKTFVLFAMNAVLIFIFFRPYQFQINDRFRLLGDSVFLFPIIYLFL